MAFVKAIIRSSADASLTSRLSTEESTSASADASLTLRLSTEESVSASADASLDQAIKDEYSRAVQVETSIDTRMNAFAANTFNTLAAAESCDGTTDTFTFTSWNTTTYNVAFVTLNGLLQDSDDYTFDKGAGILTYMIAPPAGSKLKLYFWTAAVL